MTTIKTISAMTFAAALCCGPVFAGGHAGAVGAMGGGAGVHSGRTVGASFEHSDFSANGGTRAALPATGTHINSNGNASSKLFNPFRFLNRFGSAHAVRGQRGQPFHQQGQRERARERSLDNGNVTERQRERERELPSGATQEQRQEQLTNASGQTQMRSQERTLQPHP